MYEFSSGRLGMKTKMILRMRIWTVILAILAAISFPESSFPLTSGSGYERLWDKAFQLDILLARNRACAIVPEVRKQ